MVKARKNYKCVCCEDIICNKGEEMEDVEIRIGNNKDIFCSAECAANWYTSEETLENIRDW
jgi:hypothetical protein